jgi:hypothetical protein
MNILRQYAYTGNLLLQRFYVNNHLDKKVLINQGEKPMYHVEASHEAIISISDFNEVQRLLLMRAEKYNQPGRKRQTYPFSGKIVCAGCGKSYRRKTTPTGIAWICSTYSYQGKEACAAKQIPDEVITQFTKDLLGVDEITTDAFNAQITAIRAENNNRLVFCLTDGNEVVRVWQDRSRAESWTEEKRQAFSDKRRKLKGGSD